MPNNGIPPFVLPLRSGATPHADSHRCDAELSLAFRHFPGREVPDTSYCVIMRYLRTKQISRTAIRTGYRPCWNDRTFLMNKVQVSSLSPGSRDVDLSFCG